MRRILISLLLIAFIATGCKKYYIIEPQDHEIETTENKNKETNINNNEKEDNNSENTGDDNSNSSEERTSRLAPDFELETLEGSKLKLSDLKGKNVIINFWATWCGFCVIEMPDLEKLSDKYKDEDLVVLAVNVGESRETVQKFMEENELNLLVLLDEDSSVANTYGARSFPSTLSVNKEGEIVTGYIGMMTYDLMEKLYGYFDQE